MIASTALDAGGSRASRHRSLRTGLIVGTVSILLAICGYGIASLISHSGQTYAAGSPSSWLPKQQLQLPVDRQLVGTYSNPAIAVAGDNVKIKAPGFSAMVDVTGPLVPGEGFLYQPQYVVATWKVHIWDVKGNIALSAADFDSIDHVGTEFRLLPPTGTTVPTSVVTGHQVTFQLRANVPIGEDLFRWAPDGNNVIAKWDNQVEND